MKFIKLKVNNYRNFEHIILDLSNKNVIFGLNDIGKSNLLSVFRLLFDRKFRANNCIESDYHNKDTEKDIEILLQIELEKDNPTIDDEIVISKIGQCGILSSEKNNLYIKLIAKFDLSLQAGEPKMFWGEDKNDLSEMQTIFNGYQIDKVFSAIYIKDITENNALFKKNIGRLINNELNEKEDINAIKEEMLDINNKIGNLPSVKDLQQNLSKNYNSIRDEKIEICIRSEVGINNLYSNLNTYIKKEEQDNFYPTSGDGRKKLLEYALYTSIAENEQEEGNHKIYVYLIEEPENHLHESMQLYLSDQIFNNMKFKYFFLTTHSPSMLYEMDNNTNLVRLYSKDKVQCNTFLYNVPPEYKDLKRELNRNLANALFYEKVLLVEGPSEELLFKKVIENIDIQYQINGKYILQTNGIKFRPYIKVLECLGIQYVVRTDNDLRIDSQYKKTDEKRYILLGINRCRNIITTHEKNLKVLDYKVNHKLDDSNTIITKKELYNKYKREISFFNKNNIYLSKVDLENDLNDVIHNEMCMYLDTENPVEYLQNKKMINMIELINKLTKEDCKKIYNSEQFYCIKGWNE